MGKQMPVSPVSAALNVQGYLIDTEEGFLEELLGNNLSLKNPQERRGGHLIREGNSFIVRRRHDARLPIKKRPVDLDDVRSGVIINQYFFCSFFFVC